MSGSAFSLLQIATASLSFIAACDLIQFLSLSRSHSEKVVSPLLKLEHPPWMGSLVLDVLLGVSFCVQHSCLKSANLSRILKDPLHRRAVYIFSHYAVILTIRRFWEPINEVILWDVPGLSGLESCLHALSWYLVYASFLIMECPNFSSSSIIHGESSLSRFLRHYRHGSFIGFTLILFVRSRMSLDRGVLALLWFSYMSLAWRPDKKDLEYQVSMWELKKKDLSRL